MAGGIDWFRWHHGSVNDPKFQLVAKRSHSRVADVIAVWACLLEAASMAEQRGSVGEIDFEAMDCALDLDDGQTARIVDAMRARALIEGDDCLISSWEKRQPKRERDDDKSTSRVQAFRERQRSETPRNAKETSETPRGEERRVEESNSASAELARANVERAAEAMKTAGFADVSPSTPKLVKLVEAGITVDELTTAAIDAARRGKPAAYAFATAEGRRLDAKTQALPAAAAADPDSRSSIEAEAQSKGIAPWDELKEQWPTYKARVRGAATRPTFDLNTLATMAANRTGVH